MQRGVLVRHMMLPGMLEDSKRIVQFLWGRYGNSIKYSLMSQYTPMVHDSRFPELDERIPEEEYEELLDFADSLGIDDYYWQQGSAAQESFVPAWNGEGVFPASNLPAL